MAPSYSTKTGEVRQMDHLKSGIQQPFNISRRPICTPRPAPAVAESAHVQ